ncbi:MAG: phasin family protein [Rhodospirillaceae bacterium]
MAQQQQSQPQMQQSAQRAGRQLKGEMQENMEAMRNRMGAAGNGTTEVVEQAARRLQDISMESIRYAQQAMERNVTVMNKMIGCRSIGELADVQREFFKEAIDHAFDASQRMYGISTEMADDLSSNLSGALREVTAEARHRDQGNGQAKDWDREEAKLKERQDAERQELKDKRQQQQDRAESEKQEMKDSKKQERDDAKQDREDSKQAPGGKR